jgi:heme-degrading monooxygenase HmoA
MFAVIFEVQPKQERFDDYLAIAGGLKSQLEAIEGFIDNERFRNKRDERWLLSLSTWRDEKALVRWRTQGEHHGAQEKGRFEVFADYHLRVGEMLTDSAAALTPTRTDQTETGAAKVVTITEAMLQDADHAAAAFADKLGLPSSAERPIAHDTFESITKKGKFLLLASWRDAAAAATFKPAPPAGTASLRHRSVRIIRDYGMFERHEAPQYYPDVDRGSAHR